MAFVEGDPSYCIDLVEATQADFDDFLRTSGPESQPVEAPQLCAEYVASAPHPNLGDAYDDCPTFSPFDPLGTPTLPVVCVDYCDAYFFCRAAGKRLCGDLEGQPLELGVTPSTGRDNEWVRACGGPELARYPYGSSFDEERCAADAPQVVATQQCEGATTGVDDLVGNVAEWTDECNEDECIVRGGNTQDAGDSGKLSCNATTRRSAGTRDLHVGIRCCANRVGGPVAPTPVTEPTNEPGAQPTPASPR